MTTETTDSNALRSRILKLKKDLNAVILAHNYQRPEVQDIADITGDSLELSRAAAKTDYDVIVFCGVHFMAESASILSPNKTVLLPEIGAGCPLADMVTVQGPRKTRRDLYSDVLGIAFEFADDFTLLDMKKKYPGVPVVAYVNTSAAVKAASDICCTSANAGKVVASLPDKEIIFAPDRNLGRYIARTSDKTFHYWDGYCPTHERLKPEDVQKLKAEHPDALFICHPECNPAVTALADHACSTTGMYDYCRTSPARQFIVGTEAGILYRLKLESPDKEFILASPALICPNMKLTSLEDVLAALQTMSPVVSVPEEIRIPAKRALDRMIAIPRD